MCVGCALWIILEHGDRWTHLLTQRITTCFVYAYCMIWMVCNICNYAWMDAHEIVAELCVRLRGSDVTQYVHTQSQSASVMSDTSGLPYGVLLTPLAQYVGTCRGLVLLITTIRPRSRNIDTTLKGCCQSDTGPLTTHDVCHHLICLHYRRQRYMCVVRVYVID